MLERPLGADWRGNSGGSEPAGAAVQGGDGNLGWGGSGNGGMWKAPDIFIEQNSRPAGKGPKGEEVARWFGWRRHLGGRGGHLLNGDLQGGTGETKSSLLLAFAWQSPRTTQVEKST